MNSTEHMKSTESITPQEPTLNPLGLSRYSDFSHLLPIKRTTVYKWIREGRFPKPVIIEQNFTAWKNKDILEWLENPASIREDSRG